MSLPLTFVESEYTLSSIVRSRKKPEQIIYVTRIKLINECVESEDFSLVLY